MIGQIVIYADAATEEFPALVLRQHGASFDGLDLLVFTQTGDYRVWDARRGDGPGEWRYRPVSFEPEEKELLILVRNPGAKTDHLAPEMERADTVIAIDPTGHERLKVDASLKINVIRTARHTGFEYAESLAKAIGTERMNAAGMTKRMFADWFENAIEGRKP